jgi:endonuclease YncB( thermonuclease family)
MKKLRHRFLLIPALILLLPLHSFAAKTTLQGKVMQVKDGDTVVISPIDGGQFFICRLYGIDSPESYGKESQAYGEESKKELKSLILGQTVEVTTTGDKTYNRDVCIIKKDGIDINLEMIKRGATWAYRKYLKPPYASEYIQAETGARNEKVGLWQESNPEPPWDFRQRIRGK